MPWCPDCRVEFEAGIETCSDCGAMLVDNIALTKDEQRQLLGEVRDRKQAELLEQSMAEYQHVDEVRAAYAADRIELAYITSMLDEAGIRYRVGEEDVGQYLQILHGRSYIGHVIYVSANDQEQAMRIAQSVESETEGPMEEQPQPNKSRGARVGIGIVRFFLIWALIGLVGGLVLAVLSLAGVI